MENIVYFEFDLQIERAGQTYRARVLNSPSGQATHLFNLPFSDQDREIFMLRLSHTRRGVRGINSPEAETARDFGGRLFEAVFDDEVRDCLRGSLEQARDQGARLRLRLRLTDTPELANLPWEYLYDRALNRFLTLSTKTPLVRYLDLPERIQPLAVVPPLRVLAMIASPRDYPPLNVEREWQKLRESLQSLERQGLVVLERLEVATLTALRRRLRGDDYHILHFIGHGGFDERTQDGVLILEDEEQRSHRVSGKDLSVILHDHDPLRLAILNACEGARTDTADPFAGTAQSLVQQGIPAVIAMQFEITDEAAITLAQEFYSAVSDGYPVDAALAEARKAIFAQSNSLEWGTPVLYMRTPDGRIFDVAHFQQDGGNADKQPVPIEHAVGASPTGFASALAPNSPEAATDQLEPIAPPTPPVARSQLEAPAAASVTQAQLEAPEGTIPLQSAFYCQRPSDLIGLEAIARQGATITIKGPRQIGKSSLLIRLQDAAERAGKRVAYLDFQLFDRAVRADADLFFRQFCARMSHALDQENKVDEYWSQPFGNILNCTDCIKHLLKELNGALIMALDEVDSLSSTGLRSDFFAMLRSWHNDRGPNSVWRHLDLVLVTATEPYQLISDLDQSPFNVGEVIELADFTLAHIHDLNMRHGAPLPAEDEERLMALVGGHPYLVRKALYEVASGHCTADDVFAAPTSGGPFQAYLSGQLNWLRRDQNLAQGMLQIIRSKSCPAEVFSRLQSAGLVRQQGSAMQPRCRLLADYFDGCLHA